MNTSLLPPNATEFEKDVEQISSGVASLALCIRDTWDAETCPIDLLPWLAWANSVDGWDDGWPEATKRSVVKTAYETHRHKGTPFAVQNALDGLGIASSIQEWWEAGGSGERGTMTVTALLNENLASDGDGLITPAMLALVKQTVQSAKRGSIHFDTQLGIALPEEFALSAAVSPSYGVFDTAFNEEGIKPDEAQVELGAYSSAHRIECREHEAGFSGVLPEEFEIEGRLAGGAHQLVISDYSLMGVA